MENQQLLGYIKTQLKEGVSKEDIKKILLQSGWTNVDINETFIKLQTPVPTAQKMSAPTPDSETKSSIAKTSLLQSSSARLYSSSPQTMSTKSKVKFAGVGALMFSAWRIYTHQFWTLITISLVPFALAILYGVFLGASTILNIPGLVVTIITILFVLLIIVVSLWSQVSVLYAIKDNAEKIGIVESCRRGWGKLLSYWWVMILISAITMGAAIIFVIPVIIVFALTSFASGVFEMKSVSGLLPAVITAFVGLIAILLPFIWFFLAPYILVSENIKGMDALMKAKEYAHGRWWGVLGRVLSVFVLAFAIIVAGVVALVYIGFSGDSTVTNLVTQAINLFVLPFALAYSFSLYQSLKEVRGEFVFNPKKGKGKFIAVGILGAVIISLGLLSSVILASLNVAREKGQDASRRLEIDALNIEIVDYSGEKGALPQSLNSLVAPGQDDDKIRDDVTNKLYEYRVGKDGTYRICAPTRDGEKYCVGDMEPTVDVPKDISLLPKYGGVEKTQAQLDTDNEFVKNTIKEIGSQEDAYNNAVARGGTALQSKDFDVAMRRFNQAWLIDPKSSEAYLGMATVELAKSNADTAENLLLEGLSFDESNAWLRCNLALTYVIKSKTAQDDKIATSYISQAKQEFEKALAYEPDNVDCKKLQSILGLDK